MTSPQNPARVKEAPNLAAWRETIARLPLTLRPILNQQLGEWDTLFPFEQNKFRGFLDGVNSFTPLELDVLTERLRKLELQMDVRHWKFSEASNTMENAAELARSEYYRQWRLEIQRINDAVDARTLQIASKEPQRKRLIVVILPRQLPVDAHTAWEHWKARGDGIRIAGGAEEFSDLLVKGGPGQPGIAEILTRDASCDPEDLWLIDSGARLNMLLPSAFSHAASLSYSALKPLRDSFLAGLNTMPKSISSAVEIMASLAKKDWTPWFPPELAGQKRLQRFVIDLFLSGNGALIFSNAFVEWAASEAMRRARPRVLVARFGMRSKPKPFTSIAIFENQEKVSTVPDVDDPANSAIDAAILAHYIWLAAGRYPEYEQSVCLCISGSLDSAWMIAPPELGLDHSTGSLSGDRLYDTIEKWITT